MRRAGWKLSFHIICCVSTTIIHEWANGCLNGCYLLVVNDLTKATEGCCFLKTADRKRNKNRFLFFSIYILKIFKSSKALSVHLNSFHLFINHSYRYPMSLRLISILPYSFFFLILCQAPPPPPPRTWWPAVINQASQQLVSTVIWKPECFVNNATYFFCL